MDKITKLAVFLLVIAVGVLPFSELGARGQSGSDSLTIGFTFHSSQDVFQNILRQEFEQYAKEKGVEVKVIDPQLDINKQLDAIETFVSLGVDVIVASPLDYEGLVPGVDVATAAGIPFVALNSIVNSKDAYYVGSEDYDAGRLEGEYMAKVLPQNAQIVYLRGTEGMAHTLARRKGVQDALLNKRTDVKLLSEQTANFDRTEGLQVMEDWIQVYPKIDGVLSANDQMSLGALEALKAAGIKGVLIAGIDGTTEAKQNVKNGTFAVTILQDAVAQSKTSLDVALKLIAGETVPKETIIPFTTISKENVDKFL